MTMATQVGIFQGGKGAKQDEADVERGVEKFANEEDKKHQNAGIFGLMNKKTKEGQKASVEDEPSSTNFWAQQGNSKSQPNKKVVGRVPKSDVDEFFRAVEENNLSSVKKLLHQHKGKLLNRKKDESEDESDEHSFWNPLEIAADMGYKEMVEHFLQQEGIEVNQQDASEWTPLLCTAERGHTEIATLLLEKGADPNIPNNDGDTPLMMAVSTIPKMLTLILALLTHKLPLILGGIWTFGHGPAIGEERQD